MQGNRGDFFEKYFWGNPTQKAGKFRRLILLPIDVIEAIKNKCLGKTKGKLSKIVTTRAQLHIN